MAQPNERDSLSSNRKFIIPLKRFRSKLSGKKGKNRYGVFASEKIPENKYGAASKNPHIKDSGQNSGPGKSPPHVVIDDFIEELSYEYECPSCGNPISEEMRKCPNCGTEFSFEEEGIEKSKTGFQERDATNAEFECPSCHAPISLGMTSCPNCAPQVDNGSSQKNLRKYECPICGATITANMTNCPICEVFLRTFIQFD